MAVFNALVQWPLAQFGVGAPDLGGPERGHDLAEVVARARDERREVRGGRGCVHVLRGEEVEQQAHVDVLVFAIYIYNLLNLEPV